MAQDQLPEGELPEIDPGTIEIEDEPEVAPIEEEPIALAETEDRNGGPSKIQTFGQGLGVVGETEYKRPLNLNGTGATRCKVYHSKIAEGPLAYLEKQINDWLDANEIEVKFVTKVVGVLEGKRAEANLIITLWY